mmetsp:Transcript_10599/g.24116  ORF Transcript_10599/g.24116 Transcript_10599/m.24116 type:complete len:358 (+) Transcript_10599:49-1122(+)
MADSKCQDFLLLKQDYVEDFEEKSKPLKEEHSKRLRELRDRGALLLACSFAEPCQGAVFHFDPKHITPEDVKAWVQLDPYVTNGLVTGSSFSRSSSSKLMLDGPAEVRPTPTSTTKVALVTGSSAGIGRAIAEALAEEGYRVVINSSSRPEEGHAVAEALPGGHGLYFQCDCGQEDQCKRLVQQVVQECGRLDALIINHGINKVIPHDQLDLIESEFLQKIFAVNLFGPLWLSTAAMPHLQKSEDGNIIMTSSAAGCRPMGSSIPYSLTKAALNQLAKLLAKSHGPVRVNAVAPGLIKTRITSGAEWDPLHEKCEKTLPLHRVGEPQDLVEVVLSILRSKYMTGQVIGVDGGSPLVF